MEGFSLEKAEEIVQKNNVKNYLGKDVGNCGELPIFASNMYYKKYAR